MLWRQGPSGEDPWITLRPPDGFSASLGRKKPLLGLNYVKISRSRGPNLTTKISNSQNFRLSQTCSCAIVGHRGHGWDVRKRVLSTRPRARAPRAPLPRLHDVRGRARGRQGFSKSAKSRNPQNLEIRKTLEFQNSQKY